MDMFLTTYPINIQIDKLILYFVNIFKNEIINNEDSIIVSMNLQSNGIDLFFKYNYSYYNYLVPYQKFFNSVPLGYYNYSFSLSPSELQPSSCLNCSTLDNIIIDLSQDKTFMQYLNRDTLHQIMSNVVNPTRVFSAFGSLGEKFKKNKLRSLEKAVEDVVFSNNPKTVLDFLGKDILMGYFNKMEPSNKMYSLGHSKNPKELLPILGYETMDYIKQAIEGGQTNLVHHLLNNGRNPHDLEKIFDEYGIKHDITKYY
jgi:hypothetical protein